MKFKYYMPTRIVFGTNSFDSIGELVAEGFPEVKRVMIVTGKRAMRKLGYVDRLKQQLKSHTTSLFEGVEPNPSTETIQKGVESVRKEETELVIGLGGGSAMDTAKIMAVLKNNPGHVEEYLLGKRNISNEALPYIAVPTTAGTASEVTPYAVTTFGKEKKTLDHEFMYPKTAVIDPKLTVHLPKEQTASTGLDALSHAVEAFWAKRHNDVSDIFALEAIRLVFEFLPKACSNPENIDYRASMCKASLYAGLAFSQTRTTAAHSVSYPLTLNFGIPHGIACALTLASFLEFNAEVMAQRAVVLAGAMNARTPREAANNIRRLMKAVGVATRLRDYGLKESDVGTIIKEGFTPSRIANNPAEITEEQLRKMLMDIF